MSDISDFGYTNDRYDSQEHVCMIFNTVKNKVWALGLAPSKFFFSIETMTRKPPDFFYQGRALKMHNLLPQFYSFLYKMRILLSEH